MLQDFNLSNALVSIPILAESLMDYTLNEAMGDFLKLRGVLKEEEYKQFNDHVREIKKTTKKSLLVENELSRRNGKLSEDLCCSQLTNFMMPTFITENKMKELIDEFRKNKNIDHVK